MANNMNIYEYNPGDMYAPVEKAQQYRDQQNTLAANQAALVRANSVKNLIAQNIDPATGRTNFLNAMNTAPPEDRAALQNMMQADAMQQAELVGKETITRGKNLENDKAELNQFKIHATTLFDQPSYDAFRAAYVAKYPFLADQLPPKYSPSVKADLLRGTDAALASAHFGNEGGMEGVARDPVTGAVVSPGVKAVATPGELLTAQTAANKLKVDQAAETRLSSNSEAPLAPKERQKREAAYPKASAAFRGLTTELDTQIADLEALRDHPGLSGITGLVYGRTPALTDNAREAKAKLKTILARGGFQALTKMRADSPNGSALGSVSDVEGHYLRDSYAPLDTTQSTESFKKGLNGAIAQAKASKLNIQQAYDDTYGYRDAAKSSPDASAPKPKSDIRSQADAILGGK
jgi:hypothetical protein